MIELLWLLPLILALVIFEAWFMYEGRPRHPKVASSDHAHKGPEVSRHEVAGHPIAVFKCQVCGIHFSGVL